MQLSTKISIWSILIDFEFYRLVVELWVLNTSHTVYTHKAKTYWKGSINRIILIGFVHTKKTTYIYYLSLYRSFIRWGSDGRLSR